MASFATVQDLANFLQQPVANSAAQLALDLASARIRKRTLQTFDPVVDDVVVLEGGTDLLRLPQRPVTAVSKVEASWAYAPFAFLAVTEGFQFTRWGPELKWRGSYAAAGPAWSTYVWPPQVRITYSHGYDSVPDDVRACALELARDRYTNPTGAAEETVGNYSWRAGATAEALLAELVETYKVRYGSVVLR